MATSPEPPRCPTCFNAYPEPNESISASSFTLTCDTCGLPVRRGDAERTGSASESPQDSLGRIEATETAEPTVLDAIAAQMPNLFNTTNHELGEKLRRELAENTTAALGLDGSQSFADFQEQLQAGAWFVAYHWGTQEAAGLRGEQTP